MTDESSRAEIIARIRHATRGAAAQDISRELQSLGSAPTTPLPSVNLGEAFLANVLINQGTADCAATKSDAAEAVAQYLYQRYR
ncbi:MAG: hypothetical protein V7754_22160, partial [Halioglobus sp.]